MKRNIQLFINDILEQINNIESFSKNFTKDKFENNALRKNAIARSLEIIGEAVKNIPNDFREKYTDVDWRKVAGLRDIIIHAYFDIDVDIVWDIIKKDLPIFKAEILKIKKDLEFEKK